MTTPMTSAQQAQQNNRTNDGKYTTKNHSEAEVNLGQGFGPSIAQQHAQKQRDALQRNLEVERQALEEKEKVLDLLAVHDIADELRAMGVKRVELEESPEYDYDAPGGFHVASEPEFIGGYQPTAEEDHAVTDYLSDLDVSFNTLAGADEGYQYGDIAAIDTTKDPGGVTRQALEEQVEHLLNTGYEHRVGGGLDPAKVTANSNSKLINIDIISSNRNMDPNHRMELVLQQAEDWDRATRNSTSRPNKYGNVPSRYNHLGGLKDE